MKEKTSETEEGEQKGEKKRYSVRKGSENLRKICDRDKAKRSMIRRAPSALKKNTTMTF